MNQKSDYIAVFDSGVGGLSVLRHLVRLLPGEKFLYFGDSANAPYGDRSKEDIRAMALKVAGHLEKRGIKALVVACNTATAAAIADLRASYPELIVVGIEPALKLACDRFPTGTIGVLATEATLRLERFDQLMHTVCREAQVIKLPASGLVELIEAGRGESAAAKALLEPLLAPWADKLDAVVLGCTHYPFAAKAITACLPRPIPLFDGGEGTARETLRRLKEKDLLMQGQSEVILENSLNSPEILALSQKLLQGESYGI